MARMNTLAKKCSHEDTRLSCIDCSAPICSNCMVQCPVGNRCSSCGKGSGAQTTKSSVNGGVKLFALSVLLGAGGGWAMNIFSIPLLNPILYFFVGLFAGQWIAKFIEYQWRDRAGKVIVYGTLLGMCFTPLVAIPPMLVNLLLMAFTSSPGMIFPAMQVVIGSIFTPAGFIAGIMRSTV